MPDLEHLARSVDDLAVAVVQVREEAHGAREAQNRRIKWAKITLAVVGVVVLLNAAIALIAYGVSQESKETVEAVEAARAEAIAGVCNQQNEQSLRAIQSIKDQAVVIIAESKADPNSRVNRDPSIGPRYIAAQEAKARQTFPMRDCSKSGTDAFVKNATPSISIPCDPDGKGFCKPQPAAG